jgi:hypothetical protein
VPGAGMARRHEGGAGAGGGASLTYSPTVELPQRLSLGAHGLDRIRSLGKHPPPSLRHALAGLLSASRGRAGFALLNSPTPSVGNSRYSEGSASLPGHHEHVDENVPDENR